MTAKHHILTRKHFGLGRRILLIQVDICRFEGKPSPIGHCVARVDREIENGQLELIGVGMGPPYSAAEHGLNRNLFAKGTTKQIGHPRDEAAQINWFWIEGLLARKGKKPLRQRFGPARSSHCVICGSKQPSAVDLPCIEAPLQRLKIAKNDGEEVVEVVCDAARELTNALHLLRLPCSFLDRTPFREVTRYLGESQQLAMLVLDRIDNGAGPKPAFVFAYPPSFSLIFACLRSDHQCLLGYACTSVFGRVKARKVAAHDFVAANSPLFAQHPDSN